MRQKTALLLALPFLLLCGCVDTDHNPPPVERPDLLWGVDANYVATFAGSGYRWTVGGKAVDPIESMADHGARVYRLRIWVEDQPGNLEPGTLEDARPLARRAQAAGLYVIPVLFMSRGWGADVAQDAPLDWATLSISDRAERCRAWARDAVRQLLADGITTSTYAIGNETDYGFCGAFERTDDLDRLRGHVWPDAARLMKATIEGVEEATGRRDLEFIVHVSRGQDPEFVMAYFRTLVDAGVPVSLAGLSYYPNSWGQAATDRFETSVARLDAELGLPVLIAEYAYAAESDAPGWNQEVDGYTLDEAGQAAFVGDLRRRVASDRRIVGAIYWSPEEVLDVQRWSAMSLWRPAADARSPGPRAALAELGD